MGEDFVLESSGEVGISTDFTWSKVKPISGIRFDPSGPSEFSFRRDRILPLVAESKRVAELGFIAKLQPEVALGEDSRYGSCVLSRNHRTVSGLTLTERVRVAFVAGILGVRIHRNIYLDAAIQENCDFAIAPDVMGPYAMMRDENGFVERIFIQISSLLQDKSI